MKISKLNIIYHPSVILNVEFKYYVILTCHILKN